MLSLFKQTFPIYYANMKVKKISHNQLWGTVDWAENTVKVF